MKTSFWQLHKMIRSTGTITMFGVSGVKVLEHVKAGSWSQSGIVISCKHTNTTKRPKFYNRDVWCASMQRGDFLVHSTNVEIFEAYRKDGTQYGLGGKCCACRLTFQHQSMGVPISWTKQNGKTKLEMLDVVCSHQCALAWYYCLLLDPCYSSIVVDSFMFINTLHQLQYPNEETLLPTPDFRLHAENGGSMTDDEFWNNKQHAYIVSHTLITCPSKMEYQSLYVKQNQ